MHCLAAHSFLDAAARRPRPPASLPLIVAVGALKCGLLEQDVTLYGGDLATCGENPGGVCTYLGVASPQACCDLCQRTPGCGSFNFKYVAAGSGTCWLKAATGWRKLYNQPGMLASVLATPGDWRGRLRTRCPASNRQLRAQQARLR